MQERKVKEQTKGTTNGLKPAKPQEKYGLYFSSSITIKDPESGKVLLKKRCN